MIVAENAFGAPDRHREGTMRTDAAETKCDRPKQRRMLPRLVLLSLALSLFACSSEGQNGVDPARVWIAGSDWAADGAKAWSWNDGRFETLPYDGETPVVTAIAVAEGRVYVAGNCAEGTCLWRDGQLEVVPELHLSEDPQAMAVSGDQVYLAGYERATFKVAYWNNGNMVTLGSDGGTGSASGISMVNDDIFIWGNYSEDDGSEQQLVYFLNGELKPLSHEADESIYSVAFDGKTLLACGVKDAASGSVALCITDGKREELNGEIVKVAKLIDGERYLGGRDARGACIWQNSDKMQVSTSEDGTTYDIAADNGAMIAVGRYSYTSSADRVWYWTGGKTTILLEERAASATAVAIQ